MAPAATLVLAALVAGAFAGSSNLDALLHEHPIQGVITMLEGLQETAKDEGKAEAEDYKQYVAWCTDSKADLNTAITGEKTKIAELEAEIESLTDTIATTQNDIGYLTSQIEKQEATAAEAKKMRESKHGLYEDEQEAFTETIDAVEVAKGALSDAESQAGGFVQMGKVSPTTIEKVKEAAILGGLHLSNAGRHQVKAFLDARKNKEEPVSVAHAGAITETFEHMEEDFKVDKLASTEDETHAKNEYNLAKQAREEAIAAAKASKIEKEDFLGESQSRKSTAEREKQDEEKALLADTTTLDDTTKDCATTKQQFEERTATRNGELEAMQVAVKILEKVTKVRNPDEHEIPQKFVQVGQSSSFDYGMADDAIAFVQKGSHRHHHRHHGKHHRHHGNSKKATAVKTVSVTKRQAMTEQAIEVLRSAVKAPHAVHKAAFGQLAAQLATYEGPFEQLKAMIQKMTFHLMDEQRDEDEHKNWCDLETETSTEKKEDTDEKLRTFTKKLEAYDAEVAQLAKDIAANKKKVEQINTYMKDETELRARNHKEIEATIKDSADAQAAIAEATKVLTKFYKDSGMMVKEPWEFVQVTRRDVVLGDKPSTWDSAYTGVSDPNEGDNAVLALLSKTNEKFANMEATAKVQDAEDQKNYDGDMQAQKIELEATETDTTMKTERKEDIESKAQGMTAAKRESEKQMDSVTYYLKDLEPACSEGDSTYDDRKKARNDEIEALRKAQVILEEAFREKAEK